MFEKLVLHGDMGNIKEVQEWNLGLDGRHVCNQSRVVTVLDPSRAQNSKSSLSYSHDLVEGGKRRFKVPSFIYN